MLTQDFEGFFRQNVTTPETWLDLISFVMDTTDGMHKSWEYCMGHVEFAVLGSNLSDVATVVSGLTMQLQAMRAAIGGGFFGDKTMKKKVETLGALIDVMSHAARDEYHYISSDHPRLQNKKRW
jgi:hypothetical protein